MLITEYFILVAVVYMIWIIRGRREMNVWLAPLISLILILTPILPVSVDTCLNPFIVLFTSILLFTISSRELRMDIGVYGLMFYGNIALTILAPFANYDCYCLSHFCILARSVNLVESTILLSIAIVLFTLEATILGLINDMGVEITVYTTILFGLSQYAVFLDKVLNDIVVKILVFTIGFTTCFIGRVIGRRIYNGLIVEKVFDKYISINTPLNLLFILFIATHSFTR